MTILKLEKVNFTCDEMVEAAAKSRRRAVVSDDMRAAIERAYSEGRELIDLEASIEFYEKDEIAEGGQAIKLRLPGCDAADDVYIGPRIGYLFPAQEVAVALCTAGKRIVEAMQAYSQKEEYLLMYYLDVFGVRALHDLSQYVREYVEARAAERGWGVGPSMQPGSVAGWSVSGQGDLYRLAHGEKLGLTLNESYFLIPSISDSVLIGMGPHYDSTKVGSMCHECPRYNECLWRRENVA